MPGHQAEHILKIFVILHHICTLILYYIQLGLIILLLEPGN